MLTTTRMWSQYFLVRLKMRKFPRLLTAFDLKFLDSFQKWRDSLRDFDKEEQDRVNKLLKKALKTETYTDKGTNLVKFRCTVVGEFTYQEGKLLLDKYFKHKTAQGFTIDKTRDNHLERPYHGAAAEMVVWVRYD